MANARADHRLPARRTPTSSTRNEVGADHLTWCAGLTVSLPVPKSIPHGPCQILSVFFPGLDHHRSTFSEHHT